MHGVLLSILWAMLVMGASLVLFHLRRVERRFRSVCWLSVGGLAGLVAQSSQTPLAELILSVYLYAFWIFGIFAQLYSLADRGFSLTMLTDFLGAERQGRTRMEIKQQYAAGRGMDYVRVKRMAQMLQGRFIRECEAQTYVPTALGRWMGNAALWCHAVYRFREAG